MDKLPEVERLSESEKDAFIAALSVELPRLKARFSVLEAKPHEPRNVAHNSSVSPSHPPKASLPAAPRQERAARPVSAVRGVADLCTRTPTK